MVKIGMKERGEIFGVSCVSLLYCHGGIVDAYYILEGIKWEVRLDKERIMELEEIIKDLSCFER